MDDQGSPLFSVIIACLNAQEHIAEALRSVADQRYESFELVVVDGGSTDATLDIIRGFEAELDGRMRWTSGPDNGLYDAMNKGLSTATGRYVQFLGADDRLAYGALETVERALHAHKWPEIVAGSVRVFGGDTEWVERPRSYASRRLPKRAPARHQSIFVARQALADVGGFAQRFRIAADYDLYLKLVRAGAREALVDDVLSEFRLGGVSSANVVHTARDYRDVRVAHGSSRAWQQLVLAKSVAAARLVGGVRQTHTADRGGL